MKSSACRAVERGARDYTAFVLRKFVFVAFISIAFIAAGLTPAEAQSYRFSSVTIEGNERVDDATILGYIGIARGAQVSAGDLNAAYQRIQTTGLFEQIELVPQGGQLLVRVREYPTINRINFEGNRRIKDEDLEPLIRSQSRRVFNPSVVETDAIAITEAYSVQGRASARVTPKVIRRDNNRVDLVFEILEGDVTEIERIGIVGNQAFSDRRLRRVLSTKQAGLLRTFIRADSFVADRIEFDKQVLRDFYLSRGYVDFRTTGVNAELAEERDGYFLTFNVEEGQQFSFGAISATSELADVDSTPFLEVARARPGQIYNPVIVERDIARMEALANRMGLNFVRVEPRINRNDRDLTLDVEYALTRGPRIFIERIDIEGNSTTLDRVVRRQFRVAEGDPFNPREIRESAERIRALGYFGNAEVNARQGAREDQVIIDVDVEEQPTGTLSFGGTYSSDSGFGALINFRETNFLGRGQTLGLSVSAGTDAQTYRLNFIEPAFLGRDLAFGIDLGYTETDNASANYDTTIANISPSLSFPLSENGRLSLRYSAEQSEIVDVDADTGAIVTAEAAQGKVLRSALGYTYTFDTRRTGLDPSRGVLLEFGQDFGGIGGDGEYIATRARAVAQTLVWNEEVTLRASIEGGALSYRSGASRVTDRYFLSSRQMRGFAVGGIGPREYNAAAGVNEALGGNMYAVARFEAEFPLGLPEEYGVSGGVFYDVGSLWGLPVTNADTLYADASLRHVVGVSVFWNTPIGPLQFIFSEPLKKEQFDEPQRFQLTISTEF